NEFVVAQRWLISNFINHHRTDSRPGICRSESELFLCRVKQIANTVEISAERNAILRRIKRETLAVSGEITGRIRREQENFFPMRTQRETRRNTGIRIKVAFIKGNIAIRRDRRVVRDA